MIARTRESWHECAYACAYAWFSHVFDVLPQVCLANVACATGNKGCCLSTQSCGKGRTSICCAGTRSCLTDKPSNTAVCCDPVNVCGKYCCGSGQACLSGACVAATAVRKCGTAACPVATACDYNNGIGGRACCAAGQTCGSVSLVVPTPQTMPALEPLCCYGLAPLSSLRTSSCTMVGQCISEEQLCELPNILLAGLLRCRSDMHRWHMRRANGCADGRADGCANMVQLPVLIPECNRVRAPAATGLTFNSPETRISYHGHVRLPAVGSGSLV